jgi:hypothetical protein
MRSFAFIAGVVLGVVAAIALLALMIVIAGKVSLFAAAMTWLMVVLILIAGLISTVRKL